MMAPPAGLEPATYGLTVRRSTDWTKEELHFIDVKNCLAPPAGLEPATYGLTVRRSTDWTKEELQF